jgi:3-oxoacyl-[acyl-carrier-protein] synthase III
MKHSVIISTGSYLPDVVIRNEDLVQFSEEARKLVSEKTGVYARRASHDNECTSDLAVRAAKSCLDKVGISPREIEAIVVSTSSPDRMQPATATRVQCLLGATNAFAFDINSVCSGSAFGIALSDSMIKSGNHGNVLFIAAEMYSRILNKKDYSTYPYFGDGAGAILFQAGNDASRGVLHSCLKTDGTKHETICVPGGGSMLPYEKMTSPRQAYFKMKGLDVFSFTIDKGPEIISQVTREAGVDLHDIRCFICHQANINILHRIAEIISIPKERFFVNLHHYGNTASASVLIALDEAITQGVIVKGDLVLLVAFGGGLSWGANVLRL